MLIAANQALSSSTHTHPHCKLTSNFTSLQTQDSETSGSVRPVPNCGDMTLVIYDCREKTLHIHVIGFCEGELIVDGLGIKEDYTTNVGKVEHNRRGEKGSLRCKSKIFAPLSGEPLNCE